MMGCVAVRTKNQDVEANKLQDCKKTKVDGNITPKEEQKLLVFIILSENQLKMT